MALTQVEGRRIRIRGTVQGVGFRPWVYRTARLAGITGHVANDSTGVTIDAFGDEAAMRQFTEALKFPPPAAQILTVDEAVIDAETPPAFEIIASQHAAERRVSIPPDLATCDACVAEIFDPANRRYRYPFTNCTNCGPRFTIARDIPYDRATTTMAPFTMCDACRREYEDVLDRRFHAQPNACPVCGPRLALHAHDGELIAVDDPLVSAAEALRCGLIVAIKGIGGFHLACDATSEDIVRILRDRKRREEKPLAVMVKDLAAAEALAVVDDEARRLLTSIERPIVVLPKRPGNGLAESIAPHNGTIGLFLPYSPLHHLLLADVGRPLVMTSGNVSDEPIAHRNEEAISRLGNIADLFLLHNREIDTRTDDSVVIIVGRRGTLLRRSRGHVPRAIELTRAVERPVLACGALLKNTFCLAAGTSAWLGPHIGDLENVETYDAYVHAIARMEQFVQVEPEVIAFDLHPGYLSTHYAVERNTAIKIPVQHHHAHVVSAMAEHGIGGPAIGIAYDGTGYGTDGTMWGGEILVATPRSFERAATFRPLPLVGSDRAIREPWRIAVALLADAFGDQLPSETWSLWEDVSAPQLAAVLAMLRGRFVLPFARGVGRYFDGFGALFLARSRAAFEGQIALEWNQAADLGVSRHYAFDLVEGAECVEIDLRQAVRESVRDRVLGEQAAAIAAAFHNTIAVATSAVVRRTAMKYGRLPVVASGGCFQNALLAERVCQALAPEHEVLLHRRVPPGDGGIALGQAVIADAMARG